jgi:uncharacterized protein (UPF0216 family)
MKGWEIGYNGVIFTYVYDKNHDDLIELAFDTEERTFKIGDVTLNMAGVTKLRKGLQQVERLQ